MKKLTLSISIFSILGLYPIPTPNYEKNDPSSNNNLFKTIINYCMLSGKNDPDIRIFNSTEKIYDHIQYELKHIRAGCYRDELDAIYIKRMRIYDFAELHEKNYFSIENLNKEQHKIIESGNFIYLSPYTKKEIIDIERKQLSPSVYDRFKEYAQKRNIVEKTLQPPLLIINVNDCDLLQKKIISWYKKRSKL